jgi:hypothetical protein
MMTLESSEMNANGKEMKIMKLFKVLFSVFVLGLSACATTPVVNEQIPVAKSIQPNPCKDFGYDNCFLLTKVEEYFKKTVAPIMHEEFPKLGQRKFIIIHKYDQINGKLKVARDLLNQIRNKMTEQILGSFSKETHGKNRLPIDPNEPLIDDWCNAGVCRVNSNRIYPRLKEYDGWFVLSFINKKGSRRIQVETRFDYKEGSSIKHGGEITLGFITIESDEVEFDPGTVNNPYIYGKTNFDLVAAKYWTKACANIEQSQKAKVYILDFKEGPDAVVKKLRKALQVSDQICPGMNIQPSYGDMLGIKSSQAALKKLSIFKADNEVRGTPLHLFVQGAGAKETDGKYLFDLKIVYFGGDHNEDQILSKSGKSFYFSEIPGNESDPVSGLTPPIKGSDLGLPPYVRIR